jgi:citrate lyase subunit beta / citryl-CoA lyase
MEDGVPDDDKEAARETLRKAMTTLDWGDRYRTIRVNAPGTDELRADLSLVDTRPDAFNLAMVRGPEDVLQAEEWLTEAEKEAHVPVGSTKLYCMIEQASALLQAYEIFSCTPRMEGAVFGPADFTVDVGLDSIVGEAFEMNIDFLLFGARLFSIAGAAAGIQRVGTALGATLYDRESQVVASRRMFGLGFDGFLIVTPRSAEPINEARRPGDTELQFAKEVVAAYEAGLAAEGDQRTSVTTYKGYVIEKPFLYMAERVLSHAEE